MDLNFSAEDFAFRDEVRTFIADHYPAQLKAKSEEGEELSKEDFLSWHKALAAKGWAGIAWPKEYGGTGWSSVQRYIFAEESARADAMRLLPFGLNMVGPVIYTFGTPEQKAKFLPRILSGDDWWCQGYSEPGAGSDLASLRTKAERFTGDDGKEYYRVNGQKTWTTLAQHADWIFALVRTDPNVKPQEGISFLLIDMKTPGITVRPIITLGGEHEVNEVWFEDVIVPVENRVFHENKGWTCAKFLLAHERTGIAGVAASKRGIEKVKDIARTEIDSFGDDAAPLLANPFFKRKVAELEVDLTALEFTELRTLAGESGGQGAGAGVVAPQDQGHRDPAAHHRARARSGRPLRRALLPRLRRGRQRAPDRPRLRPPRGADLFQRPQDVDLRRLERDPAEYHREDGAGALI